MEEPRFTKVGEIRVSLLRVNIIGILISIPVTVAFVVAEIHLHGISSPSVLDLLFFVIGFLFQIVIHELLHAVGYTAFGGLRWNQLKFGINWKYLAPYCICLSPVALPRFRWSGLLPTLVLFPVFIGLWLAFKQWWLAFLAVTALLGGIGDIIMLMKTRRHSSDLFIAEHPSGIGGDLFTLGGKDTGEKDTML
jgi:hypothetical protein